MAFFTARQSIRARVMERIESRIADGQASYDDAAELEDRNLAEGVRALADACSRNKETAAEDIVRKIIG